MADVPAYYEQNSQARADKLSAAFKKAFVTSGPIGCSCHICADHKNPASSDNPALAVFGNYDDILPETVEELTPHQYLLCDQSIPVYVFKTREWRKWSVALSI